MAKFFVIIDVDQFRWLRGSISIDSDRLYRGLRYLYEEKKGIYMTPVDPLPSILSISFVTLLAPDFIRMQTVLVASHHSIAV